MTNKEFWQLKVGDFIIDEMRGRLLMVTKREVLDEVIGFVIRKESTTDIYNGRKYVQLTTETTRGNVYYYDSMKKHTIQYLTKM